MNQLDKDGRVVSPRAYLLNQEGDKYEMLKLSGGELSFDVDSSKLPCGMNGALYLSEMEEDGGKSELNPTGASYGGGYCDAQCYTLPFINGVVSLPIPSTQVRQVLMGECRPISMPRDRAATRWISGRLTPRQPASHHTRATRPACTNVLLTNVLLMVSATSGDVHTTLMPKEIRITTVVA